MSRPAGRAARTDMGTFVPPPPPHSADINFVLLAVLAACVAFWVLVGLTVYWLI